MGVVVRIDAYAPDDARAVQAFRSAFGRVRDLAGKLSSYREDSELRQVEESAWRQPMPVSEDFARVLGYALRIARESGGAFDPTVGAVTRLVRSPASRLDESRIQDAWMQTGWMDVVLDPKKRRVYLREQGLQLDLGGLAKGYIADQALLSMQEAGVPAAMVAIAGDIAVGAAPPGKPGWTVGLDATGERGTIERSLTLRNQAVSTSGSRERYYTSSDGRRCSHVVTAASSPCADTKRAVSVVAPSGLEADALATALLAMTRERSEKLLAEHPRVRVYWAE